MGHIENIYLESKGWELFFTTKIMVYAFNIFHVNL